MGSIVRQEGMDANEDHLSLKEGFEPNLRQIAYCAKVLHIQIGYSENVPLYFE
jgi:hypothetical protein